MKEEWPASSGQGGATKGTRGQSGLAVLEEADDVGYELGWDPGCHVRRLHSGRGVMMSVHVQMALTRPDAVGTDFALG